MLQYEARPAGHRVDFAENSHPSAEEQLAYGMFIGKLDVLCGRSKQMVGGNIPNGRVLDFPTKEDLVRGLNRLACHIGTVDHALHPGKYTAAIDMLTHIQQHVTERK